MEEIEEEIEEKEEEEGVVKAEDVFLVGKQTVLGFDMLQLLKERAKTVKHFARAIDAGCWFFDAKKQEPEKCPKFVFMPLPEAAALSDYVKGKFPEVKIVLWVEQDYFSDQTKKTLSYDFLLSSRNPAVIKENISALLNRLGYQD